MESNSLTMAFVEQHQEYFKTAAVNFVHSNQDSRAWGTPNSSNNLPRTLGHAQGDHAFGVQYIALMHKVNQEDYNKPDYL